MSSKHFCLLMEMQADLTKVLKKMVNNRGVIIHPSTSIILIIDSINSRQNDIGPYCHRMPDVDQYTLIYIEMMHGITSYCLQK